MEVRFFREEAPDPSIDVLVGTTLSGRIRISEEEAGPEFRRDVLVQSEFAAVVSGDRVNDLIVVLQRLNGRSLDSFAGLSRSFLRNRYWVERSVIVSNALWCRGPIIVSISQSPWRALAATTSGRSFIGTLL